MKNAIFYHDGCDICASVGLEILNLIGLSKLDIIHVRLEPSRMSQAEKSGVKAYPALVTASGNVLHFNVEEHEGSLSCLFQTNY